MSAPTLPHHSSTLGIESDDIPGIPPPLNTSQAVSSEELPESVEEPSALNTDIVSKIVPNVDPVTRTLVLDDHSETFTQQSLSVFRKIEFFGLLGRTIEDIVDGPDGVNIDAIFGDSVPGTLDDFKNADAGEITVFVSAIAKIASYAPDFLKDAYLIILNVPHNKKTWARLALDEIDDDLFEDILTTFIDQNYKELKSFFTERSKRVLDRIQNLQAQN